MALDKRLIALGECDIVAFARELLVECRESREQLLRLETDDQLWAAHETARASCATLFSEIDSEILEPDDVRDILRILAPLGALGGDGPAARAAAQALDESLHERFAGLFSGKVLELRARTVFPVMTITLSHGASSRPESLALVSDQIPHLGLMPDEFKPLSVTMDWTDENSLAGLKYGARAAIGVPNDSLAEFEWDELPGNRLRFFNVRPKDGKRQRNRLFDVLRRADRRKATLVVLPELTACSPAVVDEIEKWLKDEARCVQVIVAGSYHLQMSSNVRRNECVTLARDGRRRVHQKFSPFSVRTTAGPALEALNPLAPNLTVHFSGEWSFVTLVCKDFLGSEVETVLTHVRPRLVVVPAMSPKLQPFKARTASLISHAQSFVLIANVPIRGKERAVVGRPTETKDVLALPARFRAPTVHIVDLTI